MLFTVINSKPPVCVRGSQRPYTIGSSDANSDVIELISSEDVHVGIILSGPNAAVLFLVGLVLVAVLVMNLASK